MTTDHQVRLGEPIDPALLDPEERLSRDELAAVQLQRLQAALAHTYANVEHYRVAWDAAGIAPQDISSLDQLAALPFTSKEDLRQNYPFGMFAVVDIYGLSEVIGPGVGCECVETKDGPTIWEDHFYPEIIDPVTGAVLPDGELGELVFTSLTKQAMPVIRYRTKDLTRLLPGTARPMRRIERISGRSDDMIILRGVNLFPTQVEELVLATPGLSPHFQLHLSRPHRMDELTIVVESAEGGIRSDEPARALQHEIKARIGVSSRVQVVPPESLERSSGKLRRIFDERPKR